MTNREEISLAILVALLRDKSPATIDMEKDQLIDLSVTMAKILLWRIKND